MPFARDYGIAPADIDGRIVFVGRGDCDCGNKKKSGPKRRV
jgi:hypothetical protein